MKPVDDELFAHIKECLTEHEEVYTPGAWERFEKRERKKISWIWMAGLSSAAAVVLIGFALFYTGGNIQNKNTGQHVKNDQSEQTIGVAPDLTPETPAPAVENLKKELTENRNIVEQRIRNNVPGNALIVQLNQPVTSKSTIPMVEPANSFAQGKTIIVDSIGVSNKRDDQNKAVSSERIAQLTVKEVDTAKEKRPRSFQEFLDAEVKSNSAIAALKSTDRKADKWEMGLMVAPSMGNAKKLNMGYGVSMDYALSDKVSISSGISYNEIGATKNMGSGDRAMDAPAGAVAMVQETKSLKSVDANLVGIDIPLGIKYYLSKKFYTNFGVSAFAVLNQKQNNNYLKSGVEYAPATEQIGNTGFKALFQTREVSEAVPSGEIRGGKYLGFYNVSFGFKQPISGSKAFSVEPFMKLPMKEFTKENLYLIGTGVRIKFDF
ncbi:hypothetical protein ABDJ41_00860 [Pedobacter sp. ASV1-7]|uniref:hypothetical protein n=1 Tax=Pedobacter sp. ASV1-7 TaxID=3145237 RepID=UPI0032E8D0AF